MNWFFIGAIAGGAGVALGAFGAHGLRGRLSPSDMDIFETGVRYQFFHALALLGLAALLGSTERRSIQLAAWAFVTGIVAFSGSLYLLVLTGPRWLGAVTPVGGLSFLVGWSALAWSFFAGGDEEGARDLGQRRK